MEFEIYVFLKFLMNSTNLENIPNPKISSKLYNLKYF